MFCFLHFFLSLLWMLSRLQESYNHFICSTVLLLFIFCPSLSSGSISPSFTVYSFPAPSLFPNSHSHPFFKSTYLCLVFPHLSSPLLYCPLYISCLSLYSCHVNNWWPIFDLLGGVKGRPKSWGQHQYWAKSTAVTYAQSACCTFTGDTLY